MKEKLSKALIGGKARQYNVFFFTDNKDLCQLDFLLHQVRKDKNSGGHLFRGEDWETSKPGEGRFIDTPSIRILGVKTRNFHTLILNQSRSLKVSLFSV